MSTTTTSPEIIPAWPFAPDWTNPIIEGLEWLTAIQASPSGAEQRQALRLSPRRRLDMPFQLYGQERSYFEMLMAKFGGSQWYVPLPHQQTIITDAVMAGTSFIPVDVTVTEYRRFGKAILYGNSFVSEVVDILDAVAGGIYIQGTTKDFPNGATVCPAFLGIITDKVVASRIGARAYQGTVRFYSQEQMVWPQFPERGLVTTDFTYDAGAYASSDFPVVTNYPVLTKEPNAINDLEYTYERLLRLIDNDTGIPKYVDRANRVFTSQKYEWFLQGLKEKQDFLDLMFTLQGRCKPVWVPTFNDDIAPGFGFPDLDAYMASPVPDREHVIYFYRNGSYGIVPSVRNKQFSTNEAYVPPEQFETAGVYRASFLSLKRLDVDTIEFSHVTPELATVSAIFRDAPDLRIADAFYSVPFSETGQLNADGTAWVTATNTPGDLTAPVTVATGTFIPIGGTP